MARGTPRSLRERICRIVWSNFSRQSHSITPILLLSRTTSIPLGLTISFHSERHSGFHLPVFSLRFRVFISVPVLIFCSILPRSFDAGQEHYVRYAALVSDQMLPFIRASDSDRVVDSAGNWSAGEE